MPPSLADRLRAFRAEYGLTQADLARELDTDRVTVARWEAGKPPVSTRMIVLALRELRKVLKRRARNVTH